MTKKKNETPGRGRPTKLTPKLHDEFIKHLLVGNYIETACALCRVNKRSVYDWLKKGNDQKRGKYRNFLNAVREAQAKSESRGLMLIEKAAGGGQWQAAAWRLERKFPKRWGRPGSREGKASPMDQEQMREYLGVRLLELSKSTIPTVALAATKALAEYVGGIQGGEDQTGRAIADISTTELDALIGELEKSRVPE